MTNTVDMLRRQAKALEAMAEDSDRLKGRYAATIREKSGDSASQLAKVANRYEAVAGHLETWASDLEEAQELSATALEMARCAEGDMRSCEALLDEDEDDSAASSALETAEAEYGTAETLMAQAEESYDESGRTAARNIERDIKDDLKDSSWAKFTGWMDDAEWLRTLMTVLSWVGTFAGIAALFIPGLGVIALVLTVAVAANNVLQAASGNGSWVDVLLSVGCLKFIARGVKAGKALSQAHKTGKVDASKAAQEGARKNHLAKTRVVRSRRASKEYSDPLKADARRSGLRARKAENSQQDPKLERFDRAKAYGDKAAAVQYKDLERMALRYPDDPGVMQAVMRGRESFKDGWTSWAGATGIDGIDKTLTGAVGQEYSDLKGSAG
ncbi:hypothetical protein [Streptomyces otsuchiensis]|uniref:hypothetical protein n=1 Tax=Streptomyces otsuchiensis TaxID=2681388 RepID=UPI00103207AD|nr:hypothetical protein [Streptomyces otsuchiensis]